MATAKSIFVISDLHLGDGSRKDNFHFRRKQVLLHDFLDHIEAEDGEVVIIGDFLELWHYPLDRVVSRYRVLLERLSKMNTVYVPGNHDDTVRTVCVNGDLPHPFLNGLVRPFVRTIGGKRFKFMHGHEVDPFMGGRVEGSARLLKQFTHMLTPMSQCVSLSQDAVTAIFLELGSCFWALKKWLKNNLNMAVEQYCSAMPNSKLAILKRGMHIYNMLRRHDEERARGLYDIAIVGHTHKAGQFDDWYFNSGSWTGRTNNFLKITPDGKVVVYDWDENGPTIRTTALMS